VKTNPPAAYNWAEADKRLHRCSWHADPALNKSQGSILAKDFAATKEKLIRQAVSDHLGHEITRQDFKLAAKSLRVRGDEKSPIKYLFWGKTCLAAYTDPVSSLQGYIYAITWHWKQLVQPRPPKQSTAPSPEPVHGG